MFIVTNLSRLSFKAKTKAMWSNVRNWSVQIHIKRRILKESWNRKLQLRLLLLLLLWQIWQYWNCIQITLWILAVFDSANCNYLMNRLTVSSFLGLFPISFSMAIEKEKAVVGESSFFAFAPDSDFDFVSTFASAYSPERAQTILCLVSTK